VGAASVALALAPVVTLAPSAQAAPPTATASTPAPAPTPAAQDAVAQDEVAQTYYEVLLRHTNWVEQQWDEAAGSYKFANQTFTAVLGNAVILTRGDYDAEVTGVDRATLLDHTLRTITYYAASNRFNGGTQWGKTLFWEATYESYFVLGAHLLWDQLDQQTRDRVDAITKGQADYAQSLGTANDPASGSWSPNGSAGGYYGDSKTEEMGVYALSFGPGVAWNPDDPAAGDWSMSLGTWIRNAMGVPAADQANPATIGGVPVSANTAHNLWDTFLVENHDTYSPHYQSEIWRTAARNAVQFIAAGRPLPEVLTTLVSNDESLATVLQTMSDSGEPFMPMINDREHMFGRDVIPLAYLAQVQGNEIVARAEANLAAQLLDYQAQGARCAYCLVQYNGEAKYEPEARSEIAISYLLHEWRDASADGPVRVASDEELYAFASGTTDYGATRPGLVAQQSANAWAATVDRAGWTKFAWAPEHDDWLFSVGGTDPSFLPSTSTPLAGRSASTYSTTRDGFDATASMLTTTTGEHAGMTTLPTGSVVYATSGTAADEGKLSLWNMSMPLGTIQGLDGDRTYTTSDSTTTLPRATGPGLGTVVSDTTDLPTSYVARRDTATFPETSARYVRMQGVLGHASYYYSIWEMEVRDGADGENKSLGGTATASCENTSTGEVAAKAIDGSFTKNTASNDHDSRWGMPTSCRTHHDWLQVDLGASTPIDRVTFYWETAAGQDYLVQVSDDGVTWRTVAVRTPDPASYSRIDDVVFGQQTAQYVRMQGVTRAPADPTSYGYSLWEMEARQGEKGTNVAAAGTATASSQDSTHVATRVNDGSMTTRWAVATSERGSDSSWVQVDLGQPQTIDRVLLSWQAPTAAGAAYRIQLSDDGVQWRTVAIYGVADEIVSSSSWLAVDDRVGLVKRGSTGAISVKHNGKKDAVVLSSGPAANSAGMVVEGYALADAARTASLAARPAVTVDDPAVRASDADGYVSLFNLSGADHDVNVSLPHSGTERSVFLGTQTLRSDGSRLAASLPAATSRVLAPQFTVSAPSAGDLDGLSVRVDNGRNLRITGGIDDVTLTVTPTGGGTARTVVVPGDESVRVSFDAERPYPLADLAADRRTFPTSPLPAGMSDPDLATDDDPSTQWVPGSAEGRMVVDLGATTALSTLRTVWGATGAVPAATVSTSTDGLTYTDIGTLDGGRVSDLALDGASARYVALTVHGWSSASAGLATLSLFGPAAASSQVAQELATPANDVRAGIRFSASATEVVAGTPMVLTTRVVDPYGNEGAALDPEGLTFTSSVAGESITADGVLTPTTAGDHVVTVSDGTRTSQVTVTVAPASGSALRVRLDDGAAPGGTVAAGASVGFTASVVDAYGNTVSELDPRTVALAPLVAGESASGGTLTLRMAGQRTLTATYQGLTGQVPVTVAPGDASPGSAQITADVPSGSTVAAGAVVRFTSTGADAFGNALDLTAGLALSVVDAASGTPADLAAYTVTGPAVELRRAGSYLVRAGQQGAGAPAQEEVLVDVTAADVVAAELGIAGGTGARDAGSDVLVTATGTDRFGNPFDLVAGVIVTSDVPSDLVTGRQVTMTRSGEHTLTASTRLADGTVVSKRLTVQVRPGPLTALRLTAPGGATVVVGEPVALRVVGSDAFGNDVTPDLADVVISSSAGAVDRIGDDLTVTAGDVGARLLVARLVAEGAGAGTGTETGTAELTSPALRLVAVSDAPVAVVAPRVTGKPRLGKVLRAHPGTWTPSADDVVYQWLRGRKPIAGATGKTYAPQRADVGRHLSVRVEVRGAGRTNPGVVVSPRTKVVTKAKAHLKLSLRKARVKAGKRAKLVVMLPTQGLPQASGTIRVKVSGSKALRATVHGARTTVTLRKAKAGTHRVVVRYPGDADRQPATKRLTLTAHPAR